MEQKVSPAKAALSYGLVFGIIMFIELVIAYSLKLDAQSNPTIGVLMNLLNFLILPVLFIALACNHYKKNMNGGYISFGQSIKCGVSVTVLAGALFAILNALFYAILPEAKEQVLEQMKTAMAQQPNMSAEMLKQYMTGAEFMMRPYISIPVTIIIYAFTGLILSLIVGAIVKKDNPGAF